MPVTGFGEIAEHLRRSTVLVLPGARGNGSGVIWSADGAIITNAHVARGSQARVQLWDGRELEAAVVSRDLRRDLAELRVTATNLPAATPADSSQLRPGELAIAIGNPLGFIGALTTGVIHADARGRVIGINTMVAGRLALAIPSNTVTNFLQADACDAYLGVVVEPVRVPRPGSRAKTFGLVLLDVEPDSPAANASLLPGDILLGTDE